MSRFQVIEAEQRSPQWHKARVGRVTGSRAADIFARLKSGAEAAARRDYRLQLVAELLTGATQESGYINADMQRGIDLEPVILAAYEARTGAIVRNTGFLAMAECMAGCSLDGDIDDFAGIAEFKAPKTATHLSYIRRFNECGEMPSDYLPQVTHNLWVSGAQFCDFVSFDNRLPEHLQYLCVRVPRDEKAIAAHESEVRKFLAEVKVEYEALKSLRIAA